MRSVRSGVVVAAAIAAAGGCGRGYEGGGELRAQKVVLQREVEGLRESVSRLERGEPVFPMEDIAVAIDEALLRDLILAELPFETDADKVHLVLSEAEVQFQGAPTVRLRGSMTRSGLVDIEAAVKVIGALTGITVDHASGTLTAKIAVDHIEIEKAAGIETLLSGSTVDEIARALRLALAERLPTIRIPVKLEQAIELPAVSEGPVRVAGARLPIDVGVDRVFAGQGRLWVAIQFKPGQFTKTTDPPEARDLTEQELEETGASLGPDEDLGDDDEPERKEGDEKKEKKEKSEKKDEASKETGR
jgi:hypothetical protein